MRISDWSSDVCSSDLQPSGMMPHYEEDLGKWAAPFVMAPINTKNVHRTNFLLGHPWGDALVYDEMVMTTIGDAGTAMAEAMAKANPFGESKLRPGEGPSKAERAAGFFRSEEPTSELQSLIRSSSDDFCLNKK